MSLLSQFHLTGCGPSFTSRPSPTIHKAATLSSKTISCWRRAPIDADIRKRESDASEIFPALSPPFYLHLLPLFAAFLYFLPTSKRVEIRYELRNLRCSWSCTVYLDPGGDRVVYQEIHFFPNLATRNRPALPKMAATSKIECYEVLGLQQVSVGGALTGFPRCSLLMRIAAVKLEKLGVSSPAPNQCGPTFPILPPKRRSVSRRIGQKLWEPFWFVFRVRAVIGGSHLREKWVDSMRTFLYLPRPEVPVARAPRCSTQFFW